MASSRLWNRYTLTALCILPVVALWGWQQLYVRGPSLSPAALSQQLQLAQAGDSKAMVALIQHYQLSVPGDPKQARYWMTQAADKGIATWQYQLGNDLLREGQTASGCRYLTLAAAQGEEEARQLLAASPACAKPA